eukprot:9255496-Pyramimonas_sp.AAC.1
MPGWAEQEFQRLGGIQSEGLKCRGRIRGRAEGSNMRKNAAWVTDCGHLAENLREESRRRL